MGLGPTLEFTFQLMFKLTTLSDAQSELMQGGGRGPRGSMTRPDCWGNGSNGSHGGPESITITNVRLDVVQVSDALALTIGGHESLAFNEVSQSIDIEVEVG